LVSPRATNEEAYLFQRFMREVIGTRNVDSTGRLCLEPYRLAIKEVLGRDYLPHTLDDIARSDCIVVAGGDLDENNNIIAANRVREAIWRQGARLIVLHPNKGRLAEEADCWFPLCAGTEGMWALGMTHLLLHDKGAAGQAADQIKGFNELKEAVKGFTPAMVGKEIGCSPDLLKEATTWLAQAQRPAFICSPPLGQGQGGMDQIRALANLALLCGAVVDGGGFHFVGPQANMVGVVEMGAAPALLPGYRPADGKGLSAVEMFQEATQGRLKAMFIIGEDPLITLPQSLVEEGLKTLELLVVQDMFLSETARRAHIFLPGLSFAESDGTFTNCEGRVQQLRRALNPPEGVRWQGEILSDVASYMGKEMPAQSPAGIFAEIASANPLYKGMAFDTSEAQWRDGSGGVLMERTAFGAIQPRLVKGQEGYPFILSLEGIFESHLIGPGNEPRAQGLGRVSRSYLAMNVEEARRIDVRDEDRVRVVTPWGEAVFTVKVQAEMRRDALYLFLSFYDRDASLLVGSEIDPRALVPYYHGIPARVEKA
jgi:predicted molibdopterin-dependent oxidoreductase YjgC